MKNSLAAPARPSTASRTRLWRLATVGLVAPVVALAACSGGTPGAATTGGSTTSADVTTAAPSSSTTPAAPTTSADVAPVDHVRYVPTNATITDADLGSSITATRVTRGLPWPAGQPVSRKEFEIVGVQVTLKAGSRYSATLDPSMLSLVADHPAQTVTPTTEFGNRWNATALKPVGRSQSATGWVFFKVDRGTGSALKLVFNRPAYDVSTTGKKFPAKTFSTVLVK